MLEMVVLVGVKVGFSELGGDVVSPVQSFESLICLVGDFVLDGIELLKEDRVVAGRVGILFEIGQPEQERVHVVSRRKGGQAQFP